MGKQDEWVSLGSPAWHREDHKHYLRNVLASERHEADNLTATVVGGTLIEYYLRLLVQLKAPGALPMQRQGRPPPPFGTVLRVAQDAGALPDWIVEPLSAFMKLRNKYAHEISYQLQESDIRALRAAVHGSPAQVDWDTLQAEQPPQPSPGAARSRELRIFIACLGDQVLDMVPLRSTRT